jgi:hypothetical protein
MYRQGEESFLKDAVFWDKREALVGTEVSEGRSASIIMVTRTCKFAASLAVTSNRSTLQRNTMLSYELHGGTFQKTAFLIVTTMKTSNLT